MSRFPTWVLFGLFVAGCGNGCSGATETGPGDPGEETAGPTGGETEPGPPPEPVAAPTVRIRAEVDPHARQVTAHVESVGPEPAEVGQALGLQRQRGDEWEDVGATLTLRDSCRAEPIECVTLVPGAVFIPPPWTGDLGDAQCECERCAAAEAGTYRFLLHACALSEATYGEPFELR